MTTDIAADPLQRAVERWRALPENERAGCARGWHRLRIAKPFGFIRLTVPENWPIDEWQEGSGMWCLADDPAADEVTLWVDYYVHKRLPPNPSQAALARLLDRFVVEVEDRGGRRRYERERADGGCVATSVYEDEERGERLRFWRWEAAKPCAGGVVVVNFAFVTIGALHDGPDETLLVRIFDETVPDWEIGEPPARRPQ